MSPIIIMDQNRWGRTGPGPQSLEYRQPEDHRSFWTGKFATTGRVSAYMCGQCGRIALYGIAPKA